MIGYIIIPVRLIQMMELQVHGGMMLTIIEWKIIVPTMK